MTVLYLTLFELVSSQFLKCMTWIAGFLIDMGSWFFELTWEAVFMHLKVRELCNQLLWSCFLEN